jgi:hypothetical protein
MDSESGVHRMAEARRPGVDTAEDLAQVRALFRKASTSERAWRKLHVLHREPRGR